MELVEVGGGGFVHAGVLTARGRGWKLFPQKSMPAAAEEEGGGTEEEGEGGRFRDAVDGDVDCGMVAVPDAIVANDEVDEAAAGEGGAEIEGPEQAG